MHLQSLNSEYLRVLHSKVSVKMLIKYLIILCETCSNLVIFYYFYYKAC